MNNILLATLFLMVAMGCAKPEKPSWKVSTASGSTMLIQCFAHPQSAATEKVFTNRLAFISSHVQELEKTVLTAKTEALRSALREELNLYRDGMNYAGSWPGWPMVALWSIPGETEAPSRFVAICRSDQRKSDLVFLLIASQDLSSYAEVVAAVRSSTEKITRMDAREWAVIPKQVGPLFDDQGNVLDDTVLRQTGTTQLPLQH